MNLSNVDFELGETILIDKPYTFTSFDAVNKLRYRLKKLTGNKKIKVGHAGTLDPLATGLLIICTGKKTKTIDEVQAQKKEYTGEIELGKSTPSYDLETDFDTEYPIDHINKEQIEKIRQSFLGDISQIPPSYSAIKVDGKRSYELARKGKEIEIEPRNVHIHYFDIDDSNFPILNFKIGCSKGTYIRSIARDFGLALNSGAYLDTLCRTKIGEFDVKNALTPEAYLDSITN